MKLAIADASDGVWDSAVFIQAGSLVSNPNPVADLSVFPETGTAPLEVTAIVEGEDPNGLPLTYTIRWGDGTPNSTGSLPDETALVPHTFTSSGEFIVTLTVSNGTLSGTSAEDVDVLPGGETAPVVTQHPTSLTVSPGQAATFNAAASGQPSPTVQWQVAPPGDRSATSPGRRRPR
jgi:PKD repeat protein